jgi:CRISPR-associated protein Cas5h
MDSEIAKLITFSVSGRFAHFRKFYTNASSLTYIVPPRTTLIGMLASILRYDRDDYYDLFNLSNFKISVAVAAGTRLKKQMQSMNYLRDKYYRLLTTGKGDTNHSPCKLELLSARNGPITYLVYIGACNKEALSITDKLERRIIEKDFGFGVYFGQRSFGAYIDKVKSYDQHEITYLPSAKCVDTVCMQINTIYVEPNIQDRHIIIDQMPVHMKRVDQPKNKRRAGKAGREMVTSARIIYESSGMRIMGRFKNCYLVDGRFLSFYEAIV